MNNKVYNVGSLVISVKGRDIGNIYMIITKPTDKYIRVVDGDKRKIINSKLKNIKHVAHLGIIINKIKDKINDNIKVFDLEIYSSIKNIVQDENINKV